MATAGVKIDWIKLDRTRWILEGAFSGSFEKSFRMKRTSPVILRDQMLRGTTYKELNPVKSVSPHKRSKYNTNKSCDFCVCLNSWYCDFFAHRMRCCHKSLQLFIFKVLIAVCK